jgi:nitroreductase
MSFHDLIRARHSVRGYIPDPIPEEVLLRVLEAGRLAPTACNLQPIQLVVVTDPETRARMQAANRHDWFWSAPVILVGCAEPAKAWTRGDGWNAAEVDLAIVMDHVILAATQEGLGTCWVCAFNEANAKAILGIPPEVRVVAMTPLGYPSAPPRPTARKHLGELVRREHW